MSLFKISLHGKDYAYQIIPIDKDSSRLVFDEAKIDQEFLSEDIFALLQDFPNLIEVEQEYKKICYTGSFFSCHGE